MASGRRSLIASRSTHALHLLFASSLAAAGLVAACGGGTSTNTEDPDKTTSVSSAGGSGGGVEPPNLTGVGGQQDRKVVSLVFDPPDQTVTLDGTNAQTVKYTLRATFEDGKTEDVAAEALQFDRPDLADLVPGPPTNLVVDGQYAGTGTLYGVFRGAEATAQLTVKVAVREVGQGVTPDDVTKLDGAGLPADAKLASLLYPYDATVFPKGLTSPLLMWAGPNEADVYKIHYEQENYTHDAYLKPGLPASARMPQLPWDKMVASNVAGPLKVTVSRLDASTGTAFSSATQTWTIAPASLRGQIYYWSVNAPPVKPGEPDKRTGSLARINPGGKEEILLDGTCVGCHAVSADGTTLVGSLQGDFDPAKPGSEFPWVRYSLPDMKKEFQSAPTEFGGSIALNRNGEYVVYGDRDLRLAKTIDGTVIANSGIELAALKPGTAAPKPFVPSYGLMSPAFAPDGKRFTAVDGVGKWYPYLENGGLVVWDFNKSTLKFTGQKTVVSTTAFPEGQRAINYPSFSPDGEWIAFQVSQKPTECQPEDACDNLVEGRSRLALQAVAGGPPIDLTALNDLKTAFDDKVDIKGLQLPPGDMNVAFEPTFMPIERGGYIWVVFTSMRDWGHRITGTPNNGKKRLWVAALRKDPKGGLTVDPSNPPFFLEGQDENTTNLRGFWALSQCIETGTAGGTCEANFECCDGFCDKGQCVTPQEFACVGVGGECTVRSDCCNDKVINCVEGKCVGAVAN